MIYIRCIRITHFGLLFPYNTRTAFSFVRPVYLTRPSTPASFIQLIPQNLTSAPVIITTATRHNSISPNVKLLLSICNLLLCLTLIHENIQIIISLCWYLLIFTYTFFFVLLNTGSLKRMLQPVPRHHQIKARTASLKHTHTHPNTNT